MSDNDTFGAFFAGFVIGGLVGAATALLLAPQSGEETRTQIQERGIELQTRAQESLSEVRTKADQVREQSKVVLEDQKSRVSSVLEEGKKAVADGRGKVGEVIESRKKALEKKKPASDDTPAEAESAA